MRKIQFLLQILCVVLCFELNAQPANVAELAAGSKDWFEGFGKNTGGNEFIYGSFRSDIGKSLITRSSDGKMAIEWQTQALPQIDNNEKAVFLWIAAMGIVSKPCVFDLWVNGVKRFEIVPNGQHNWQLKTADGGTLSFTTVELDGNKDHHGYMWLEAPVSWLKKGEPQTIKIVGHANENNSWIIVYQATDALDYLQKSERYNASLQLSILPNKKELSFRLDGNPVLSELYYQFNGKTVPLTTSGSGYVPFSLPLSALHQPLKMFDRHGELFNLTDPGKVATSTRMLSSGILKNVGTTKDDGMQWTADRKYRPRLVKGIAAIAASRLAKGQIYLMNSSHQDIAWMDSPEKCVIERDTMLLSPLIEKASHDKNYRFDVEDALMLKEFISRHPEKKEMIRQMLADGRLSCGSTFIQPYEEMYSGESLARQFYYGAKWLKNTFQYDATVYWNEDVPGRTLQMAQLMAKAGTEYLMISRHERGLFNWYSPDGSYVTAFSPGHYGDAYGPLQKNFDEAAQYLATSSAGWEKYFPAKNARPVIPLLSDNDMSPAKDYSVLIQNWAAIRSIQNENGKLQPVSLPSITVATAPEFFRALAAQQPTLPSIMGERPNVWLYIHGPSHQHAIQYSREADILLPMAEKFAVANCLVDGNFANYPTDAFNRAWEAKIYPDHGWGGKHGDITDAWFSHKYESAKGIAASIIEKTLGELASKVATQTGKGRPLVVFNSMNTRRNDPVHTDVFYAPGEAFDVELYDAAGHAVSTQKTNVTNYADGSLQRATISFIAEKVPEIGYATFYCKQQNKLQEKITTPFKKDVENQFYRLVFSDGGLSSVYDKQLGKELVDSKKIKAGEIFTMRSVGNGAGEFIDVQQPDMQGYDHTGAYPTEWQLEENGPVFSTYMYRQKIRHAVIEQRIRLYHLEKRIDFLPSILNWEGVLYREFRMALPLNMTDGKVVYEVPFGTVQVGKDEIPGAAGERYTTPCKNVRPRGIENWIGAVNDQFGVIMSSSVAVADWVDPTDQPIANQMLQPILLASRKSCHWEGNDYLQTGNHYFSFSITSVTPAEMHSNTFGRRANEPLKAVWADQKMANASLPEAASFFKTDEDKVFISTVKKAEDSNDIIVRLNDMEGKDRHIRLGSFRSIESGEQTNLIEEKIKPLNTTSHGVAVPLGHYGIETIKIKPAPLK